MQMAGFQPVLKRCPLQVRDQLMDWLCDREMTVYQTIFSMSGDAAKLDRFERRFAWFKTRLEERKEVWAVFPDTWRVPQTLCLTFCKITKASLKRILSDSEDIVREDVGPLIKTVVATNKFEKEMAAMFGGGSVEEDEDDLQVYCALSVLCCVCAVLCLLEPLVL